MSFDEQAPYVVDVDDDTGVPVDGNRRYATCRETRMESSEDGRSMSEKDINDKANFLQFQKNTIDSASSTFIAGQRRRRKFTSESIGSKPYACQSCREQKILVRCH